jgi:disulfide bond formation protein DsbB
MQSFLTPVRAGLIVCAASLIALGAALVSQFVFGLQPCVLCVYQRWPYVAAAVLGVAAALLPPKRAGLALTAAAAALAVDAGIAAFHVGVEQHWWTGTESCTGTTGAAGTLAELKAQLLTAPIVRCDEVAFSLFGVSMAGYNFLYASALCVFTLAACWRWLDETRQA